MIIKYDSHVGGANVACDLSISELNFLVVFGLAPERLVSKIITHLAGR